MSYSIRIGGVWMHQLAPVGDIKYSWGENGPLEASWGMALPVGFLHPALVMGSTVEIFYAGCRVWRGVLEEPNRDDWTCTAVGFSEMLGNVAMLAIGAASLSGLFPEHLSLGDLDPYTAARYAVGQGSVPTEPADLAAEVVRDYDFTVDVTVPNGPGAPTLPIDDAIAYAEGGKYLNLRAALDAYTKVTGKRWMVDENGLLSFPGEPTTPTVALTPSVPGVGLSLENYYSATYLRYLHHFETSGGESIPQYWAAVAHNPDAWRWGKRERTLEFDPEKQISEFAAQMIVDSLQAEATAAPTESVELSDGQLVSLGGTRIPLPLIKTPVMVRHFGVLDVPGARNVHEWIINHFEMDTTTGTATITPRHVAPRTLAQVVQSLWARDLTQPITADSDAA